MNTDSIRREWVDRREASRILTDELGLPTPVATLHRYGNRRRRKERGERETGEIGPPYRIWGIRAVYRRADLIAWVRQKLGLPEVAA